VRGQRGECEDGAARFEDDAPAARAVPCAHGVIARAAPERTERVDREGVHRRAVTVEHRIAR
jgi:hypothetical protein